MERFRRLVESAPDGILIVEDERIAFLNAAAADLLGADEPEQLIGQSFLHRLDGDSLGSVREHLARWRTAQRTAQKSTPIDAKIVRRDGTVRDISIAGAQ